MSIPAAFNPRSPRQPPRLPRNDFDVPFAEAIAWAEQRGARLAPEFYAERLQAVRARSFTVSGLAALDQVQQVADSLAQATAAGQTLREWQQSLPDSVFSLGRARRELIFRNAVQTHYGAGRTIQQRENAAARPFLMWDAINDGRTRPAHAAMDGRIAPIDDPIWKRWSPPAGHNCRCTRIALTEAQARARGYPKAGPAVEPDSGWEGDPTDGNEDLVRIIKARQDSCAITFAPRSVRARGLWCDQAQAGALLQRARSSAGNGGMRQPQGVFTPYDIIEPRGTPDVSTAARAAAVAFENEVRLATIEHGAAFAADGRLILRKAGEPNRVGYTDAEIESMRGSLFTHNHPNGASFSFADVRLASRIGLVELRAVGPQFRHILVPAFGRWPSESDLRASADAVQARAQRVVEQMIYDGLRHPLADVEKTHRIWEGVARRLGLTYLREYT